MSAITKYLSAVVTQIEWVLKNQGDNIEEAAKLCADSIEKDGLVFTFGTGHGAFPALESFPRTGTVTGFRPIVESSLLTMHHVWGDTGTAQYRFIHKVEGFGRAILQSHHIGQADSLILFSHSGINPVIIDSFAKLSYFMNTSSTYGHMENYFKINDLVVSSSNKVLTGNNITPKTNNYLSLVNF